jgi:hypothetical protein
MNFLCPNVIVLVLDADSTAGSIGVPQPKEVSEMLLYEHDCQLYNDAV